VGPNWQKLFKKKVIATEYRGLAQMYLKILSLVTRGYCHFFVHWLQTVTQNSESAFHIVQELVTWNCLFSFNGVNVKPGSE